MTAPDPGTDANKCARKFDLLSGTNHLCPLDHDVLIAHLAALAQNCAVGSTTPTTRSHKKELQQPLTSKPSSEEQDDHNDDDQPQSSTRVISPRPAVRPRG